MNTNRIFAIYWAIVILVMTFIIFKSPVKPRDYKNFIFLFSGLSSIVMFGISKIRKDVLLSAIPLIGLGFLNQHHFMAANPTYQFLFMLTGFGVFMQFYERWSPDVESVLYGTIAFACLIQCLWVLLNYYNIDPYQLVSGERQKLIRGAIGPDGRFPVIGSLGHWMVTGSYLSVALPFVIRLNPYLLICLFIAAFALPSGAMVFCGAAMAMLYGVNLFWKNKWFWIISILSLILGYIVLEPYGVFYPSERIKIWITAFDFVQNPIIGNGLGYFSDAFKQVYQGHFVENHAHPHNEFVAAYVSFGVVGLLIFSYWIVKILALRNIDIYATLSLIAFLAAACFGFPFHISSIAIIAIISLASILNKSDNKHTGEFI